MRDGLLTTRCRGGAEAEKAASLPLEDGRGEELLQPLRATAALLRYPRRMSGSGGIIGRWRITEMDSWDQEAVDLVEPGFIEFDEDGLGELGFIAVTGELDCRDADRNGSPGVEFSWQGSDEGDDASGRGWAALNPDGTLEGHIYFHLGEDSAFHAERFNPVVR